VHLNKFGGLALACLLTAGSLAACSSKKNTTVDAAGKTTTTTAAPASGSSSGDTSGGSGDTGNTSGSGSSGSGGAITDAQCVSAAAGYAKVLASVGALTSGNTSEASQLQAEYDALGASIPDNLKGDYQTVAKAYAKFEQDIKGVSFTDPSSMGKLQQAEKDLDNSDVKAASNKISAYFDNHCKG